MKLQQILLQDYLRIPFEDFSHKAVSALGLLTSLQNSAFVDNEGEKIRALDKSIERINQIIEESREDIQVSLFILDRNIIPQDLAKSNTNYVTSFTRKRKVKEQNRVTLSQDDIQQILCNAIKEINIIVMQELGSMSEQSFFDDMAL